MERWQELEKAVEDLLNTKGLRYLHISNYRCFKCGQIQNAKAKGHPDFEIYHPHFYCECKSGKTGRLTKEQKEVKELLQLSNIPYLVIRDVQDLITFLEYGKWWKEGKGNKKRLKKVFL